MDIDINFQDPLETEWDSLTIESIEKIFDVFPSHLELSNNESSKKSPTNDKNQKKKVVVRESEEKRRRKFQRQIETLRKLLFSGDESERVTREDILDKAIQAISSLGSQPQVDFQPQNSPFGYVFPYHEEELEHAYKYIVLKQISLGFDFNANRTTEDIRFAISAIKEIVEKMNKIEFKLQAAVIEMSVQPLLGFSVKNSVPLCEKALSLYAEAKSRNRATTFINGFDVLVRIYVERAIACCLKGDFKSTMNYWQKARMVVGNNSLAQLAFLGPFSAFKMIIGCFLNMDEVVALLEVFSDVDGAKSIFRPFLEAITGITLLREGHVNEGLTLLKSAINSVSERLGHAADVIFASVMLNGFIEGHLYDEGIEFADRTLRKSAEFQLESVPGTKLKAVLLFCKLQEIEPLLDANEIAIRVAEINRLLQESFQKLAGRECTFLELKTTVSLAEVIKRYGDSIQRSQVLTMLQNFMKQIVWDDYLCAGSTEISKARRLLDEQGMV